MKWDAQTYDRVAGVQEEWGRQVLDRVPLDGDEVVMDAGCGSGRVTAPLLERLPRGFVYAVDKSSDMLVEARQRLSGFAGRVEFVCADLCEVSLPRKLDLIFSNAVLHWVLDHDRLFRRFHSLLAAGGRLQAQCGGQGNLAASLALADEVQRRPEFAAYFEGWRRPTNFASAEETAERLSAAGFRDVSTGLVEAPAEFAARDEFAVFVKTVVLSPYLHRLPDDDARRRFLDQYTDRVAAAWSGRFWLDYIRLNLSARKE